MAVHARQPIPHQRLAVVRRLQWLVAVWYVAHCRVVLFGLTISDVLGRSIVRDQHLAELWSGVAAVVRGTQRKGLNALPFDKHRAPNSSDLPDSTSSEDMLTCGGFFELCSWHVLPQNHS